MKDWPEVTEPLLGERQAMSDDEFLAWFTGLLDQVGERRLTDEHYETAIGYPWGRHPGSCRIRDGHVADLSPGYEHDADGRLPLLAYGANASPERLALKLAHLPEGHRDALILAGDLAGFDVGACAQAPLFSSIPATLIPSPATTVRVAVLFLDQVQFTAIWWTELTYRLGALSGITLRTDAVSEPLDRVLAFVSRWGAFSLNGEPVAMSAIEARDRRSRALTQLELMEAVAELTLGPGAGARDLIKAAYEDPAGFFARHRAQLRSAAVPFSSSFWTELRVQ